MSDHVDVPSWVEDDGTQVWLVLAAGRGAAPKLEETENLVRPAARPGAVFGANADADDEERLSQLTARNYHRVLSMVELQRDTTALLTRPVQVHIRSVIPADYTAMHRLTATVWSKRPFFTMPSLESYRLWVDNADPEFMLLAFYESELVGYIAAECHQTGIRIDDVQVHPLHQRRGIATELIRHIAEHASQQTCPRLHLETEGDDPVGARTFYERLGFSLVKERLRYRKAIYPHS